MKAPSFSALATVGGVLSLLLSPSAQADVILSAPAPQPPSDLAAPQARPTKPTIALAPSSDTGPSKSDRITRESRPVFKGEAEPGSTVVITEKSIALAQGVVSRDGRFEIALPKQADGNHRYAAAQIVRPGVGIFSNAITVRIDTEAPSPPRLDLSKKPKTFKGGKAFVSGSVGEKALQLKVYEGRKLLAGAATEGNRRSWTTDEFKISGGTHVIHAVALDLAGNVSKPSEEAVMLVAVEQKHLKLAELDKRTGIILKGGDRYDEAGFTVAGVGDVNGDGMDDVAIGARGARAGNNSPGVVYLLFGSRSPFPAEIDLSRIGEGTGAVLQGGRYDDNTGGAIAGAGDVNADGIGDVLVGVPGSAKAYLVFGRKDWPGIVEMARMKVGEGVEMDSPLDVCLGGSVDGGGDVNGDGIDDMVFGCGNERLWFDRRPGVFVVYGRDKPFPRLLRLDELDGRYGSRLNGEHEQFGFSVSISSDLNADGIDDVVVSEPNYQPKYPDNFGRVYVLYGGRGGFGALKELGELTGTQGFSMTGDLAWREYGRFKVGSVSGGGDLNSDGVDDIVITAENNGLSQVSIAGFVVFGDRGLGKKHVPVLSSLDGEDGFRVAFNHQTLYYGQTSLRLAADVDGDKKADLLGGFARENNASGTGILMYGRKSYPQIVSLAALGPNEGLILNGPQRESFAGASVAGIGDFNGDGIGDFALGVPGEEPERSAPGAAYIIFGKARN